MTSEMRQTENNQRIFDDFVRHVLDRSGVPQSGLSIEGLLESIEHGEASVNAALNLIVVAHAVFIFLEVCTPIEEPEWTDALKALRPRIESGLQLCRRILAEEHPDSLQAEGAPSGLTNTWHCYVPTEYGLETWYELKDYPFFSTTTSEPYSWGDDYYMFIFKVGESSGQSEIGSRVKCLDSPGFGAVSTTWHLYMVRDAIRALEAYERIDWDSWCTAVELCSEMMSRNDLVGVDYPDYEHGLDTSEIRLPPTSAEYWAWEFGRVAAMWSIVDKRFFVDGEPSEYDAFAGWENGLAALSLLPGGTESSDDLIRTYWIGALCTWSSEPGLDEIYPSALQPFDHLLWLMRIGAVDGTLRLKAKDSDASTTSSEPSGAEILMLGKPEQLARAMQEAQEYANQERERRIENELAERLGIVWNQLPPDTQEHLLDAKMNVEKRDRRRASQDYANAVEVALSEWLTNPENRRDWPRGIGQWGARLRRRTNDGLNNHLSRRFDYRNASKLADALKVLEEARLPGAHGWRTSPLTRNAQEAVFGGEQGQSVFELILRFAKRWQG